MTYLAPPYYSEMLDRFGNVFHSTDLELLVWCQLKKIVAGDDVNNVMDGSDDTRIVYGKRCRCANDADHDYEYDRYL